MSIAVDLGHKARKQTKPIMTAADDKFRNIFPKISKKIRNDISGESSARRRSSQNIMPNLLFLKKQQNLNCPLLQIIVGALWVKATTNLKKLSTAGFCQEILQYGTNVSSPQSIVGQGCIKKGQMIKND